jgi:hypothetical protein
MALAPSIHEMVEKQDCCRIRRENDFGFSITYPRKNKYGAIYKPWHWTFQETIS